MTASLSRGSLELLAVEPFPDVREGDHLGLLIARALPPDSPSAGDIFVVAQKIVSKAEGRYRRLADVTPREHAHEIGHAAQKDPRLVELILQESQGIVRVAPGVIIARHRRGWIMANAGIDASNVGRSGQVLLLPEEPDRSAEDLRRDLRQRLGVEVGVLICDSWGRPWRMGSVGITIGAAGVDVLQSLKGRPDREGRLLETTEVAVGDELAAAASLLMGQADEGRPVVRVRGWSGSESAQTAKCLLRPEHQNLFS